MSALGFRVELEKLINRESRENGSNTPDFILAEYLAQCLVAFDHAVQARERHYGRPFHLLDKADARLLKHCNACGYTHWEGLPCPETKSAAVETFAAQCGCWQCSSPERRATTFIVCPICGNKRCPKATNHENLCTGSNDSGQPGSRF